MSKRFLFAILLVGLLSGCGGRNSNQTDESGIQISAEVGSMLVGQTELQVTVLEASGLPINDATVSIKGDMAHAGMQPVLGESSSAVDGVYTIPYEWTMAGDWFVTIDVELADGTAVSKRFDFTGIGGDMEMDHGDMEMQEDE